MFLFLARPPHILGCGRPRSRVRETLVPAAAPLAAQFVDAGPDGCPVEPAARLFAMRAWRPPELPEHLHRQLLRACRIADHARDDAGNTPVMGVKCALEIERRCAGFHLGDCSARSVHNSSTPPGSAL